MKKVTHHSDESRRAFCLAKDIDPSQHCCLDMAWFISDPVEFESQGSNPVLLWIKSWNEYRINIPRGGNSSTIIRFCPWCGSSSPISLQETWLNTLYALGFEDPGEQDIPPEFESDAWWRNAMG